MSEKDVDNYQKLIKHLDIAPSELMMIGNSLKSDILPVLEIGSNGVHIPYHITWSHETISHQVENSRLISLKNISEVLNFL